MRIIRPMFPCTLNLAVFPYWQAKNCALENRAETWEHEINELQNRAATLEDERGAAELANTRWGASFVRLSSMSSHTGLVP